MQKYFEVAKISLQGEFAYRINFIMWRLRNVFQILLVYFLWDNIFADPGRNLFGYDRSKILTYVIGLMFVRAFVLSAKAMEVSGEISRGDLNNYLTKPVNYFFYWLSRDIASKVLNLGFAFVEIFIFFIVLKPDFYIQTNPFTILLFIISISLAVFLYFFLLFLVSCIPFWAPEVAWGGHFLVTVVILEFLSGALFPLDILPSNIQNIFNLTPFPYLIFFPIQVYLGKIQGVLLIKPFLISFVWIILMSLLLKYLWKKGIKAYEAYGR